MIYSLVIQTVVANNLFWSVLPALLAIALAMMTRRVIVSLLVGVFAGSLILASGHPGRALYQMVVGDLAAALLDFEHLQVFAFTLSMGAMVGVIQMSGGMSGLIGALQPLATSRRRGQLVTWLMGLIIFFDIVGIVPERFILRIDHMAALKLQILFWAVFAICQTDNPANFIFNGCYASCMKEGRTHTSTII